MNTEDFFTLFLEELKLNKNFHYYYKFLEDKRFEYRKAYFLQRLEYINKHAGSLNNKIWDCGCGFGTSAIFLALNGYSVYGSTTEHYFKELNSRFEFWSKIGNLNNLKIEYHNLFDQSIRPQEFDRIIVQDTLHHLEPIDKALDILNHSLKNNGQLIVIEENGSNIIQSIKDYRLRGNKRIIEIYDEYLKKNILIGNENTRSFEEWISILNRSGFKVDTGSYEFIRFYLPMFFNQKNIREQIKKEGTIWRKSKLLRKYFYFGINFIAEKVESVKSN